MNATATEIRTEPRKFTIRDGGCFDEWGWQVGTVRTERKTFRFNGSQKEVVADVLYWVEFLDQRYISRNMDIMDVATGQIVGSFTECWDNRPI